MKNKRHTSMLPGFIGIGGIIAVTFIAGWFTLRPHPLILQGEVEATEVRVSGKIPGRITAFTVQEGYQVKKGDTLVFLNSPELYAKLDQAVAAVDAAEAMNRKANVGTRQEQLMGAYEMWQKAVAGKEIAQKSFDRIQNLFQKGVVPAQKRDEAEAQYKAAVATEKAAKAQYDMAVNGAQREDKEAAEATVNRAKGALEEVQSYISETSLLAPISGEISEIYPKEGELVGTGSPIMSIMDLSDIWVTFNIREDLLNNIGMETVLQATVPALGGKEIELKVNYISPLGSYATWKATKVTGEFDAKTFEVRAKPVNKVEGLRPGMSVLFKEKL